MGSTKTLVVVGGGAAGFFCAVNAARQLTDARVIIVEKTSKLLSKVRISGGGRCNVTHACFDMGDMAKRYPRGGQFVRKAFHQFFTTDTIKWFEERGMPLKTEADNRMFPLSNSSQSVVDVLVGEANRYGVEIMMNASVERVEVKGGVEDVNEKKFGLVLAGGRRVEADAICIACGGYPKASMFEWITGLGHSISEPVPSLFTFNIPGHPITGLMGVSVERAGVRIAGTKLQEEGPVLITHWGLSGPAVLRLSAWGARELIGTKEGPYRFRAVVNWLPEFHEAALVEQLQFYRSELAGQKIVNRNPFGLPARLWEFMISAAGVTDGMRWSDLPAGVRNKLAKELVSCEFAVNGKTTFKEEFVTAGGVKLNEVDHNTMMSKKLPGLFFAGEILDVDGITGGFNFQHAWTSGYIAAASMVGFLNAGK